MLINPMRWSRNKLIVSLVAISLIVLFGLLLVQPSTYNQIKDFKKLTYLNQPTEIKKLIVVPTTVIMKKPAEIKKLTVDDLDIQLDSDDWFPAGVFGNNVTGYPMFVVPNIVHYALFGTENITFSHMISMMSVIRHQKPEIIYIHCDCDGFNNTNWHRVLKLAAEFGVKLTVRRIEKPTHIFGHQIDEWVRNWHGADYTRVKVLHEFGGIFLDNDIYVCQSLDVFRKFEMTLNWDEGQYLGCQVLIGNRNARFLKFYEETYRLYDTKKWYYNAGELPTKAILFKYPQLVHRVKVKFGVDAPLVCPKIFREYHQDWRQMFYTVHLTLRDHQFSWPDWCFGRRSRWPKVIHFDEEVIKTLDVTFGEMARLALYGRVDKRD